MKVGSTSHTIAAYCEQIDEGKIVVNREYQRSPKVWPVAARSYLLDTVLMGFPVPKLSLYQKTDLRTRKTIHEIVDGQQRSEAINLFFKDKFRITGESRFAGKTYSALDDEEKEAFISYQLSFDVFTSATEDEVRQVFRRMNSYNIPLNEQEKRHSKFQGPFKWFIVHQTDRYSQAFKELGVFRLPQLVRMKDSELLAEIALAFEVGIETWSQAKITNYYKSHEVEYGEAVRSERRIDRAFAKLFEWQDIHRTSLMKPFNFYSLFLAISHLLDPVDAFQQYYEVRRSAPIADNVALLGLSTLDAVLEQPSDIPNFDRYVEFVDACEGATNTFQNRQTRFQYFCKTLTGEFG